MSANMSDQPSLTLAMLRESLFSAVVCDALDSLECLLKSIGLDVKSYQSPSGFLQEYDPTQPGCIVLDVRMPELSGLELQLELNRRGPTPPIIVITGHGDVPVCAAAFRAGAGKDGVANSRPERG